MPVIRQNKEQQQALEYVTKALEMATATAAITEGSWSGSATIQFSVPGRSRRGGLKVTLEEDDKEISNLMKLIRNYRQRICKDAIARAQKYNIELTSEEAAILTGEDRPRDDTAAEAQAAVASSPDAQKPANDGVPGDSERVEEQQEGGEALPTSHAPTPTSDFFQNGRPQADETAADGDDDDTDAEFAAAIGQLGG